MPTSPSRRRETSPRLTGAAITCTVTNATAALTILKQVIDPRPGFQAADWKVTATPAALPGATLTTETRPGAEYVASGNPASTFDVRPGHGYTLSEAATDLTRKLAYQELRLERLSGSTWVPVAARTISAPPAGQTAVYRFVNAPVAPTTARRSRAVPAPTRSTSEEERRSSRPSPSWRGTAVDGCGAPSADAHTHFPVRCSCS